MAILREQAHQRLGNGEHDEPHHRRGRGHDAGRAPRSALGAIGLLRAEVLPDEDGRGHGEAVRREVGDGFETVADAEHRDRRRAEGAREARVPEVHEREQRADEEVGDAHAREVGNHPRVGPPERRAIERQILAPREREPNRRERRAQLADQRRDRGARHAERGHGPEAEDEERRERDVREHCGAADEQGDARVAACAHGRGERRRQERERQAEAEDAQVRRAGGPHLSVFHQHAEERRRAEPSDDRRQSDCATAFPASARRPAPTACETCADRPTLTRFMSANAIQSVNMLVMIAPVAHAPSPRTHAMSTMWNAV